MSYIVIIEANLHSHGEVRQAFTGERSIYAITVATDPQRGLAHLQAFSPIPCALVHSIKSDNRTDLLERTLHIRYQLQRDHGFWFRLATEEITFLKSITPENLNSIPGLLKKAPPPDTSKADLETLLNKQLQLCEKALT